MFEPTSEETAAYKRADELSRIPKFHLTEELKAELLLLENDPMFLRYAIKQGLREAMGDNGSYGPLALRVILEEIDKLRTSPEFDFMMEEIVQTYMHLCRVSARSDLQDARASVVASRWKALTGAGVPNTLAHEIMVAEASRPWPTVATKR